MPTPIQCQTCRHWRAVKSLERNQSDNIGECRAGPPARDFAWPRTKPADHCGSHMLSASFAEAQPSAPTPPPAAAPLGLFPAAPTLDAGTPGDGLPGFQPSSTGNRKRPVRTQP